MKRKNKIFSGIIITIIIIFLYFVFNKQIFWLFSQDLDSVKEFIMSFGIWAPLIYMLLMLIAIVVSTIPSLPLSVVAGIIWGPILATVYSVIGASIGAVIAFLIARFMGRTLLEKYFEKYMDVFDKTSENVLMLIIFVMRLFPFFQFDIVSYGAGFTKIKLWKFFVATFVGMIPMTFLFTYLGSGLFNSWKIILGFTVLIILMILIPFLVKDKVFKLLKKI